MYIQLLSCELGNCCKDSGIALILSSLGKIFDFIQIIVPIILIVMATIKFFQLMMNPELKGGMSSIKNMFIGAAIVFLIPLIVNVVLGVLPNSFTISVCWVEAKTIAEASRKLSFQYVSPFDEQDKKKIWTDSDDYEKGQPKAKLGDAKGILEGAEKVHKMYEDNNWFYYDSGNQLYWKNIEASTNNPYKATCCATFVGSALYVGGVFTEDEMNEYNYNSSTALSNMFEAHGWTKITSYNDLEAGDIVIMSGSNGGSSIEHIQIYAGDGTWYNAGSTKYIQMDSPYSGDASGRFLWAWRNTN